MAQALFISSLRDLSETRCAVLQQPESILPELPFPISVSIYVIASYDELCFLLESGHVACHVCLSSFDCTEADKRVN